MGGLFSAPAPPPPPLLLPEADTSKKEEGLRKEALERRRRGRSGTIATTPRGFLTPTNTYPKRKSLLGE